ncbi:MAG: MFS transporter [Legionellaceae bacterium]|nr:MFS transporter [Legionellaceae bacterium]
MKDKRALVAAPRAWSVCLSAGLFFFYEFFQLNIFDVINAALRSDFNIDAQDVSFLSSTFLWANVLFLLPAGIILDRYSVKRVILAALGLCILGTAGFAMTQNFWFAAFCHGLTGIGNAFCFIACVVLVSRWFPAQKQAFILGLIVTMAFLGGMMAHTPFAYAYKLLGWRLALGGDAALGVFFALWIAYWVMDSPEKIQRSTPPRSVLPLFICAIKNTQTWLAGLYTACLNLPIMILCALWGASFQEVVYGLEPIQASSVVSLLFVGSMLGCPILGYYSDKQGRRLPWMWAGLTISFLLMVLLLLPISFGVWSLSMLFFGIGFFTSSQVISYPLIAESNQAQNVGAATAIASVVIMGGGAIGQLCFGYLLQYHNATGHYLAADYHYALYMFPVTLVLAAIALLGIRETYCQPYAAPSSPEHELASLI